MSIDPETVSLMATYRVGFMPPAPDSLAAGELYVEVAPEGGGAPRLWIGTPDAAGFFGNATSLVPLGVELPPRPAAAPVNVDGPAVTPIGQATVGDTLNCTMGNWENEPETYHYQWQRGATPIGTDSADYVTEAADEGHEISCLVTAENIKGSTQAPPSNAVAVAAAAARSSRKEPEPEPRNHHRRGK